MCTRAEDVLNDFIDRYPSKINLFSLKDRLEADMMEVLREYRVSATCPEDDIFVVPRIFKKKETTSVAPVIEEPKTPVEPDDSFDKEALKVYKRIPLTESVSIESLVTDEMPLRILMRYLLKLEVNGFIVMLPGEMVARKFK
jgi:hypothetical protein